MVHSKVTFIGAGNVAWHLSQAMEKAGFQVQEVYSRNIKHAQELTAHLWSSTPTKSLDFSRSKSSLFILTVADDAMSKVVEKLVLPEGAILIHTSGTQPLEILSKYPLTAVLYPLQTFSKHKALAIEGVPFCVEGNNADAEEIVVDIAEGISSEVHIVNSEERKLLHIGAVFACNFTNHLLAVANHFLNEQGLDFNLLKPLIEETFTKALSVDDPASVQTGPAIRKDKEVIARHLAYLQSQPTKQAIYRLLTESIMNGMQD